MSDPTPTERSEISQDSRDESDVPALTTPAEAMSRLRGVLPPNPELDTDLQALIRQAVEANDAEVQRWIGTYLQAQKRFEDMSMSIFAKVAEGGSLLDVIELVADWMDGCDCIDDESIAAFNKAKDAITPAGPVGTVEGE